jgi:serine/threonine protein kinase
LDPDRVARFEREAKLLAALNHPNIASIYGLEESDGTHFLIMELIEGYTLADRIKKGSISIEECLRLAQQVSEALESAHEHGVIHRDLKPANIKITPQGRVKVLDFGLAKTLAGDPQGMILSNSPAISEVVTQQGAILGTAAYMSPEQAEGKPVDTRSDIFSFGAVLYETLTGKRAFQGESNISILGAVLRSMPAPVRKLRAEVPAALERIVNHCLEKDRDARYVSAAQVMRDLTALQSQISVRRIRPGVIMRRPGFAIPALVILAVVVLIIGWFLIHNSRVRWARDVALPEIYKLIE